MLTAQVYGVREAIAELRKVDPALAREAQRTIKAAAEPLAAAIRTRAARAPISGLEKGWSGRTTIRYGGRARGGERPLVRVSLTGKNASIADMAGRRSGGTTPQGAGLIRALDQREGKASRYVWAEGEKRLADITAAVLEAAESVMAQVNQNLVTTRAYGGE